MNKAIEGQCVTGDTLLPIIRLDGWMAGRLEKTKKGVENGNRVRIREAQGLPRRDGFHRTDLQDHDGFSRGSLYEVMVLLKMSYRLMYLNKETEQVLLEMANKISVKLNNLITSMK